MHKEYPLMIKNNLLSVIADVGLMGRTNYATGQGKS